MFNAHPGLIPLAAGGGQVHLKDNFNQFWSSLTGAAGMNGIVKLAAIVGVALVAWALIKWAWDRRRGGGAGGQHQGVMGALLIGAILSAPSVLLPILLTFLDVIVNGGIKIYNSASGG